MKALHEKNPLYFALAWIGIYLLTFSLAQAASEALGVDMLVNLPVGLVLCAYLLHWVKRHGLSAEYGLVRFIGKPGDYLYFLPLVLLASCNLWNGVQLTVPVWQAAVYMAAMLCVGVLEELIFRGFLFQALCKDGLGAAIVISAVTFGIGHIVNLLNGAELLPTLLQICYAMAAGFLFTVLFYRSGSLLPCIVTHGVLNALSIFQVPADTGADILHAAILTVVAGGYAWWVWTIKKASPSGEAVSNPSVCEVDD